MRLAVRLRREDVHERAVWGLLVYRNDELRALLEAGVGVLTIDDPRALSIGTEQPTAHRLSIPVASLLHSLAPRIRAYRTAHPNVWTGSAWVSAARLAEARA